MTVTNLDLNQLKLAYQLYIQAETYKDIAQAYYTECVAFQWPIEELKEVVMEHNAKTIREVIKIVEREKKGEDDLIFFCQNGYYPGAKD